MLEILKLNNYPWTRLTVRIIGVIKRQLFHMVTHVFDSSNLSQEIFAIDTWGAVRCSLGHGRKHMLTILPTRWRPGLKPGLHIVVRVAEHACDDASKRILMHSAYRLQIFPVRDQYLRPGGALPYKPIRDVPFFSINSWTGYENWSEIPKRVMTICSRTKGYCFPLLFPIVL